MAAWYEMFKNRAVLIATGMIVLLVLAFLAFALRGCGPQ